MSAGDVAKETRDDLLECVRRGRCRLIVDAETAPEEAKDTEMEIEELELNPVDREDPVDIDMPDCCSSNERIGLDSNPDFGLQNETLLVRLLAFLSNHLTMRSRCLDFNIFSDVCISI